MSTHWFTLISTHERDRNQKKRKEERKGMVRGGEKKSRNNSKYVYFSLFSSWIEAETYDNFRWFVSPFGTWSHLPDGKASFSDAGGVASWTVKLNNHCRGTADSEANKQFWHSLFGNICKFKYIFSIFFYIKGETNVKGIVHSNPKCHLFSSHLDRNGGNGDMLKFT